MNFPNISNKSHLVFSLNPTVLAKWAKTASDRVAEEQRGWAGAGGIDRGRKATVPVKPEWAVLFAI